MHSAKYSALTPRGALALRYMDVVSHTRSSTMSSAACRINWCRWVESSFCGPQAGAPGRVSDHVPRSNAGRAAPRLRGRHQLQLVQRHVGLADHHEVRHPGRRGSSTGRDTQARTRHAARRIAGTESRVRYAAEPAPAAGRTAGGLWRVTWQRRDDAMQRAKLSAAKLSSFQQRA